jgi:DNA invertase Pin-like site-specific DNA recombinase
MNIGYARVSTERQSLESQVEQLGWAGCSKIYSQKVSSARTDRPELLRLLKGLEPGSVVIVTRLDRFARSTIDLLTIVKQIADPGCLFKSLADPWCNSTTPAGRLLLTVLSGLAEFERELIKARTTEGPRKSETCRGQNGTEATALTASDCRDPESKGSGRICTIFLWRESEYDFQSEIAAIRT